MAFPTSNLTEDSMHGRTPSSSSPSPPPHSDTIPAWLLPDNAKDDPPTVSRSNETTRALEIDSLHNEISPIDSRRQPLHSTPDDEDSNEEEGKSKTLIAGSNQHDQVMHEWSLKTPHSCKINAVTSVRNDEISAKFFPTDESAANVSDFCTQAVTTDELPSSPDIDLTRTNQLSAGLQSHPDMEHSVGDEDEEDSLGVNNHELSPNDYESSGLIDHVLCDFTQRVLSGVLNAHRMQTNDRTFVPDSNSGPTASSRSNRTETDDCQASKAKKNTPLKRSRNEGDESDKEDAQPPPKRMKNAHQVRVGRRLACPFYQRKPGSYQNSACTGPGFENVSKLKQV